MFKRLQQKWKVTPRQFWIIFIAFGFTGITTAWLTKIIATVLGMTIQTWWGWKFGVKLAMLIFGYQFILLFYGALFGQWTFFWGYEKKILQKLRLMKRENAPAATTINQTIDDHERINIAIFASGAGTNALKIIDHFYEHPFGKIKLVVCNKPYAGVLAIAKKHHIQTLLIEKDQFFMGNGYLNELRLANIQFIVLAGFLLKIPDTLIEAYPGKIVNIHPALLPKFGGKGMYGHHVHAAVIAAGEKESGITIHFVDGHYDNGDVIFQATCPVHPNDTSEMLACRIHELEHKHFATVIEQTISTISHS